MSDPLRVIQGGGRPSTSSDANWTKLLEEARKALARAVEIRVSPSCIRPMPGQPRVYFSEESILRLADSIRSVGQVYPGIVRKVGENTYELLDGERRWRAVTLVGVEYRALLVEIKSEAVPFLIAAIANFNREGHTPLEIVDSIVNMHERIGMPMREVAKVLGITDAWTSQMYSLRKLHPDVREMLDPTLPKEKRLPITAAIRIAQMKRELQVELARRVLSKDVSLNGLRTEAVRVSKKEGIAFNTRTHEPARRWKLVGNRMQHLRRYLGDLEDGLNQPDLSKMVRSKIDGFDITRAVESLQDLQRILARCETMLSKARRDM